MSGPYEPHRAILHVVAAGVPRDAHSRRQDQDFARETARL
jgi:hypothetical protein